MGNLAAVKLLLLFSPQKHSGSLSQSSLASQIVKKKKKTLYKHNMTTRPETKQKSETSYLSYGLCSIHWNEKKNYCSRCTIVIIFRKSYLELFFCFVNRRSVSKDQCSQKMIVISIQAVQIWHYESLLRPVWASTCTWKPEALRAAAQPLRTEHSVIIEITLIEYNIAWKE